MAEPVTSEKLRLVVVTPETTVLEGSGDFVAFPAFDGEVGILPGHSPLVARLAPGEVRLKTTAHVDRVFIDGGFAQVQDNVVTILTPHARPVAQLDREQLRQQLASLNAEVPTGDDGLGDKARRLKRLHAQLQLTK